MVEFINENWIALLGVLIAILSLFVNFSKFFIELSDRKEKRKKEHYEDMKARLVIIAIQSSSLFMIENKGKSDAFIKSILFDGSSWEDVGLIPDDRPTQINADQQKVFHFRSSVIYPKRVLVEYVDEYSRIIKKKAIERDFEL